MLSEQLSRGTADTVRFTACRAAHWLQTFQYTQTHSFQEKCASHTHTETTEQVRSGPVEACSQVIIPEQAVSWDPDRTSPLTQTYVFSYAIYISTAEHLQIIGCRLISKDWSDWLIDWCNRYQRSSHILMQWLSKGLCFSISKAKKYLFYNFLRRG